MAFILYLLDAPELFDAVDAEAFVDEQRDLPPSDNAKFSAFVHDITQIYPDFSEEDEDGDACVWEEGLDDEASYGEVKELVVSEDLADEDFLAALISVAEKNGLKLYDAEGEVVYPE
ncbi:MAG TPA: hypothetical protein ENO09_09130 [bacterium]|nr:hypothetical protein [bacterium]